MSIAIAVLLFLVLFLVFLSMTLFVIGPVMLLQPHRRLVDYYRKHTTVLHPSDLRLPHEELILRAAEGIPLSCWFIPCTSRARGTVIFLHGVSECKDRGAPHRPAPARAGVPRVPLRLPQARRERRLVLHLRLL